MKIRPFEITLLVVFGLLMVVALILLRVVEPKGDPDKVPFGVVTIWGTLPALPMTEVIETLSVKDENYGNVYYEYVDPEILASRLIEAIADGAAPDLLFASQEELTRIMSRVQNLPYTLKSLADYRTQFIDGADIFLNNTGFFGYPLAVDPLLLYWNRDLFSANGLITAPATWEEMVSDTIPSVVRLNNEQIVIQPAVALGEQSNIAHYMPILSMLLLQSGSEMVQRNEMGRYDILLNRHADGVGLPFTQAATFYTNFSTPTNSLYTWNDKLPLDREAFIRNELGMYFGFGSEAEDIAKRNPNLNFDVAPVPQGADATVRRTYGKIYALFVTTNAPNPTGAYKVLADLATPETAKQIADKYGVAPANRSLLLAGAENRYSQYIYSSALFARGWYNPNITRTKELFGQMIEEINTDRGKVSAAVSDTMGRLEFAY